MIFSIFVGLILGSLYALTSRQRHQFILQARGAKSFIGLLLMQATSFAVIVGAMIILNLEPIPTGLSIITMHLLGTLYLNRR